jgi:hypothetical protein
VCTVHRHDHRSLRKDESHAVPLVPNQRHALRGPAGTPRGCLRTKTLLAGLTVSPASPYLNF